METQLGGLEDVVKAFEEAYETRDVERILGFFADDGEWVLTGLGAFKGKEAVRKVVEWDARVTPTVTHRSAGIGMLAKDNVVVREAVAEATYEGLPYEIPIATIFEFGDDRKIRSMHSYYDKLGEMQQIANQFRGIKGWFPKKLMNYIVAQGAKGLDKSAASS